MSRKRLTKAERQQVYEKYDGHCAYCGKKIDIKDMQVDHRVPLYNGGEENMENYMPSCRMCNHYKRTASVETFRKMISEIPHKLERDSYIYRVARAYGLIAEFHPQQVRFYYEAPWCWDKECSKGYHVCCYFCEEYTFCPEACDDDICAEGKMNERTNI